MAQPVKNVPAMQETREMQVQSLSWEDILEKEIAAPGFLPEEVHEYRIQDPTGYSLWVTKRGSSERLYTRLQLLVSPYLNQ